MKFLMIFLIYENLEEQMSNRYFTEDHEWVELDGETVTIGISTHAADELGEIVYVDLPDSGSEVSKGDEFGSVESVKTVSGIYSPVDGEVIEKNNEVVDSPESINQSPLEQGWLIKVKVGSTDFIEDLMDEQAYHNFLNTLIYSILKTLIVELIGLQLTV